MKQTNHVIIFVILCFILIFSSEFVFGEVIAPSKGHLDPNSNTVWYDCKLLKIEGKGWADTECFYDRLPARVEATVTKCVWELSHHSAGMCVRFMTDANTIEVRWTVIREKLEMAHMPSTGVSGVDLYARDKNGKWQFVQNGRPRGVSNIASFEAADSEDYLLYLPLYNGVKSIDIGIAKDKKISKPDFCGSKTRKPIVFYGTSITQGACASRPGMAYTALVGRDLDLPVINLGFSGCGRMEPAMADLLAELDASVYVLDCIWNMGTDMVSSRVEPFVRKLREVHPQTPILLAEDSSFKNITPTEKGRVLRAVYKKLKEQGVTNLYFLSNELMLGSDGEGTVDGIHPNDLGMMRQAKIFSKVFGDILKTSKKSK